MIVTNKMISDIIDMKLCIPILISKLIEMFYWELQDAERIF